MASQRQDTLGKIKQIESSMKEIYSVIENKNILHKNKLVYDMYCNNKNEREKKFFMLLEKLNNLLYYTNYNS